MANFFGSALGEWITPGFVSSTVSRSPLGAFPGSGSDFLNGGGGADIMDGGDGNDTYVVDNPGDVAKEAFGDALGGVDTVLASLPTSFTYRLSSNLENLTLTGSNSFSGEGNAKNNVINGNVASNHLFGWDGDDTIRGGGSDDLTHGGAGNDKLYGDAGNDTLVGGTGFDTMSGGTDRDTFVFNAPNESPWSQPDLITDFTRGLDKISVQSIDANVTTSGNEAFSWIGTAPFTNLNGSGFYQPAQLRYFLGNDTNGSPVTYVEGNTDFNHDSNFVIKIQGHLSLTATDFIL